MVNKIPRSILAFWSAYHSTVAWLLVLLSWGLLLSSPERQPAEVGGCTNTKKSPTPLTDTSYSGHSNLKHTEELYAGMERAGGSAIPYPVASKACANNSVFIDLGGNRGDTVTSFYNLSLIHI